MADYNLGTARGTIEIDYRGASGVRQAEGDINRLGSTSQRSSKLIGLLGKVGIASAGTAIAGGFGYAVKSAADFEQRMSAVKAVSGASASEMDKLKAKALQLGKDTSFSASESALAIEELVKAGVGVPDVMGGAADAVVNLAAAGEISLPQAATIASNAMNAFGLSAKEMPKVADLIAGAANASAIDVGEFGQSLQQVGAVAKLAGMPFKDVSVAIAELGNAGIKGSDAGTSLKTMLNNLQPSTKKAATTMKELGIITADGTNRFYDQNGKLKSLKDIQGILAQSLSKLTPAQRQMALATMFGSDAIRAASVLSQNGAAGYDKMYNSMSKVTAADVAKTRLDNLKGSLEQLKGTVETIAIMFGSVLLKGLKIATDGVTDFLNKIIEFMPKIQTFLSFMTTGDFTSAFRKAFHVEEDSSIVSFLLKIREAFIQAFGNIKTLVSGVVSFLISSFKVFGPVIAGAVGLAIIAFGKLSPILATVGNTLKSVGQFMERHATTFRILAAAVLAVVIPLKVFRMTMAGIRAIQAAYTAATYGAVGATYAQGAAQRVVLAVTKAQALASRVAAAAQWLWNAAMAANPIGLIIIAIIALVAGLVLLYKKSETFRNIVNSVWNGIKSVALSVVNWFKTSALPIIKDVWDKISNAFTTAYNKIAPIVTQIVDFIKEKWSTISGAVMGAVSGVVGFIRDHWDQIKTTIIGAMNTIKTVISTAWNLISSIISTAMAVLVPILQLGWTTIKTVIMTAMTIIKSVISVAWTAISSIISVAWTTISGIITTGIKVVTTIWQGAWNMFVPVVQAVWNLITAVVNFAITFVKSIITGNTTQIKDAWNRVWTAIGGIFSAVWNAIKVGIQTVLSVIQTIISGALSTIKGAMSAAWNGIKATTSAVWNAIKAVMSAVWSAIKTIVTTYINTVKSVITTVWNAIKATITAVVNGIKATISAVWNAIKTTISTVNNTIKTLLTNTWNTIKATISAVVNSIKTTVSNVFNTIRNNITNAVNSAKNAASNAFNSAKQTISSAVNSAKQAVSNAMNEVVRIFSGLLGRIRGALSGAAGALVGIGKDIVRGLINGIKSMGGSIKDALVGLLPGPLKKFAGKLGIGSPSKLFRQWGVWTIQGYNIGVKNMYKKVDESMGGAAKIATKRWDDMKTDLSAGVNLTMKTEAANAKQTVITRASSVQEQQLSALNTMRQAIEQMSSNQNAMMSQQLQHLAAIQRSLTTPLSVPASGYASILPTPIAMQAGPARPLESEGMISIVVHNPQAEKASDSIQRSLTRTAQLGLIGGRR